MGAAPDGHPHPAAVTGASFDTGAWGFSDRLLRLGEHSPCSAGTPVRSQQCGCTSAVSKMLTTWSSFAN